MRKVVSFDCYRTLINFDTRAATHEIVKDRLAQLGVDPDQFHHDAYVMRFQGVVDAYRPYREIVRGTLRNVMLLHGLEYRDEDGEALVEAIKKFKPFREVPDALRRLKSEYDIAILSNSEDDLISYAVDELGVEWDYVLTAEQAGAYKPLPQAFEYLMKATGRGPEDIIHTAQGWEYDIMPTKRYPGMRRIWVNRYGFPGSAAFQPYEEIRDLSELPGLLGV
ncbi:HAD-IA family hydrolase [Streptomyces sp. NBC_00986]|uniref:HAD-IA family hydrolase n=1 Tax=Streptomyces sp. NBC_00986 TaxID=2903702 RepID=UPI00386C2AAF|nr:HAD-IA family hydrolase [Streptomyces sp. NBC_00986]